MRHIYNHFQRTQRLKARLLFGCAAAFGLFIVVYLLLLYQGVAATAELRYIHRTVTDLQQQQQELETQYLTAVAGIDLALAHELGFVRIEEPRFVVAGSGALAQADLRRSAAQ